MFIQFGNHGFNTDHITRCHRFAGDPLCGESMSIEVHTSDGGYTHLKGENAQAFALFWDSVVSPMADASYWAPDVDPMAPDYNALAAEEYNTFSAEGRDSSGHGQV